MTKQEKQSNWSLKQSFFLNMGGFVVQNDSSIDEKHRIRVRPEVLLKLFQRKAMPWPTLSDAEINDRSKADWIAKGLAIIQSLWFTTQLIGRWAQGLAVTTLELFTFGIVICAIVTYIAWWEKPFDVQVPVVLQTKETIPEENLVDRVGLAESHFYDDPSWVRFGAVSVCLIFGAIHIAGWNFHFPSMTEQLLWRISSIACAVLPFILLLLSMNEGHVPDILEEIFYYGLGFLYVLFRVYMYIEMFISLRAAPASVYQTPQWSQYFPSFG
jgi:hypothetical protein